MIRTVFITLFIITTASAQYVPVVEDSLYRADASSHQFSYRQLIIPGALVGFGVLGIKSDQLIDYNLGIREEVQEHIDDRFTIDDFSQYTPMLSVYALNAAGIRGKHNLGDRTIIMATSYIFVASTVTGLKHIIHEERPDGSSFNSFPSGHTATAFSGAEFLFQEYKDKNIWYGISGFVVATGTGMFRMYNNRHWLTDVVAGAGIGILSTKAAYWLFPYEKKYIFGGSEKKTSGLVLPYYNGNQVGISASFIF
ncbi:phosphatase PAP2 family protein [Flavobacterium rhizosphaerae]|uniref:Phosphatase PAP2 family protein n=1 Tax=Flavobacterium rhizosphaerae TaxID=3163298 RepID=A0ABW8YYF6_9FLAO